MNNSDLQIAYETWVGFRPKGDKACCRHGHFSMVSRYAAGEPKPDEWVCDRELAWRRYVRLRDDNPDWPFLKSFDN